MPSSARRPALPERPRQTQPAHGSTVGAACMAARLAADTHTGRQGHLTSGAGWRILQSLAPWNLSLRRHSKNSSVSHDVGMTAPLQGEPLVPPGSGCGPRWPTVFGTGHGRAYSVQCNNIVYSFRHASAKTWFTQWKKMYYSNTKKKGGDCNALGV